jgi:putative peptidoglycan lipid II flippase
MVEAIKNIFTRETAGLHQAAFLLGIFALASQLLALVRDKLLAATFGASGALDTYYAAFRIPDFLFVTLGSVVSLTILIPFLIQVFEKGESSAKKFIDSIFTAFVLIMASVAALLFALAPILTELLFPGFAQAQLGEVVMLTRILLASPLILGISNLFGSLTQSRNRFFVYAISPLFYNLGIIVGVVAFYPRIGISGLAMGVVVGAIMHLLIQLPTVYYLDLLPRITLRPQFGLLRELVLVSVPRTLALSVSHISIFFLLAIASLMSSGSITVFTFAFNLQSVPLSIFGVSYSLAAFPALSRLYVSGARDEFIRKFISSARHIAFWAIPCSVLFIVLRAHIVRIVLGSGAFDWSDTKLTAALLALFSISLVFQSLVLLFVRALYAAGVTGKPFVISAISGATIVLSSIGFFTLFKSNDTFRIFFESVFKINDVAGSEAMMLALGFTVGSIIDCILLWVFAAREWKGFTRPILKSLWRIGAASVIGGFASYSTLTVLGLRFTLETFYGVFAQATLASIVGGVMFVVVMVVLKAEEMTEILLSLRRRFVRTETVSPDTTLV